MAKVLVLGGTGFIGRVVCERLVDRFGAANARIVVPTRRPARARALWTLPTLELIRADVHDDRDLAPLVHGCDGVVNLVGVLHGTEATFERAHAELPRRLARACSEAGVRRVVHLSALGAAADAPSRYLRSKARGEAALKESAALEVTILRPSVVFGEGDRFLNLFARLQSVFPVIPLAAADARFQPVWVGDVAAAIVRCLDDRTTFGETIECCGPQVYSLRELVQIAGRLSGHPRPVIGLPDGLARLQAGMMQFIPGEPLLSSDNLDSMRVPSVATGTLPGLERLGITPTTVEAIAPHYLGGDYGPGRLGALRAGAHRR